jgi:2-polyprenyl-6-methoxyphenol hydroxylase-like FAD-dependent oxidoreductase
MSLPEDHDLPVDDGWNFNPIGDFTWDNHGGKVTLAGDAAHSMLPHRGQGLNNAFMDAAEIVNALKNVQSGGKSLRQAIQDYEEEMRPRGSEEVDLSIETMMTQSTPKTFARSPLQRLGMHRPSSKLS